MGKYVKFLLIPVFISIQAGAQNLVINGDFEQSISTGWTQSSSGSVTIDRSTSYDADGDYEGCANKNHVNFEDGYAQLYQIIDVAGTNLEFSCKAKCEGYESTDYPQNWTAGAIIIGYLNSSGTTLGETRIYHHTNDCPWTNSSTTHLISVPNTNWNNYSFNLNDELSNLSGVNPASVSKIKISLYSYVKHDY